MAVREFTLAIGIGEGHHTAAQKTMGALATPFAEQRKRFIEQWQRAANPEWLAAKAQDGGKLMRASHTCCWRMRTRRTRARLWRRRRFPGARRRATTTWAATTWCGRATWCRRRRRCWPAGARRRRGGRWCTWPARSSRMADLRRISGSTERRTGAASNWTKWRFR